MLSFSKGWLESIEDDAPGDVLPTTVVQKTEAELPAKLVSEPKDFSDLTALPTLYPSLDTDLRQANASKYAVFPTSTTTSLSYSKKEEDSTSTDVSLHPSDIGGSESDDIPPLETPLAATQVKPDDTQLALSVVPQTHESLLSRAKNAAFQAVSWNPAVAVPLGLTQIGVDTAARIGNTALQPVRYLAGSLVPPDEPRDIGDRAAITFRIITQLTLVGLGALMGRDMVMAIRERVDEDNTLSMSVLLALEDSLRQIIAAGVRLATFASSETSYASGLTLGATLSATAAFVLSFARGLSSSALTTLAGAVNGARGV